VSPWMITGPTPNRVDNRSANADARDRRRYFHVGSRHIRHFSGNETEGPDHFQSDHPAFRGWIEDIPVERQPRVLAKCHARVVLESDFQPSRRTSRHAFVDTNGSIQAERLSSSSAGSTRISLYATDRADRIAGLLGWSRTGGKAGKKHRRNDHQLPQNAAAQFRRHVQLPKSQTLNACVGVRIPPQNIF